VRPYLRRLALAAVSLIGASVMGLIFPAIIRSLIDSVFVHHDERALNVITAALLAVFAIQGEPVPGLETRLWTLEGQLLFGRRFY